MMMDSYLYLTICCKEPINDKISGPKDVPIGANQVDTVWGTCLNRTFCLNTFTVADYTCGAVYKVGMMQQFCCCWDLETTWGVIMSCHVCL